MISSLRLSKGFFCAIRKCVLQDKNLRWMNIFICHECRKAGIGKFRAMAKSRLPPIKSKEKENTMKEQLEKIKEEALRQIESSEALERLNEIRVAYLGKVGESELWIK